ncbi:CerR family C-terminal domain-containing protein [Acidobacteria bacterium AH-259-G07]|nr:CerR family C-terminal domain-containing protein [Acidobacteria bacterium AH-259-G07]
MKDTKQKIIQAATKLFAQEGLEGVSIRQISQKAGVNLAAINYHFHSKEQLYMGIITEHFQKMRDYMAKLDCEEIGDERVYIKRFVRYYFELLFHRDKEMELIIGRELSVPSTRRDQLARDCFAPALHSLIKVIQRGTNRGRFRNVEAPLAALSLVGMCVFYANKRDMLSHMLKTNTFTDKFRDRVANHTAELFVRSIEV